MRTIVNVAVVIALFATPCATQAQVFSGNVPKVSKRDDIGFLEASKALPNLQAFKFEEGFTARLSYCSVAKGEISPENNVMFVERTPDTPIRVGENEFGILVSADKNAKFIHGLVVGTPTNILFAKPLNTEWYAKVGGKKCPFVAQIVLTNEKKVVSAALVCITGSPESPDKAERFLKGLLSGPLPTDTQPVASIRSVDESRNRMTLVTKNGKEVQVSAVVVNLIDQWKFIIILL